MRKLLIVVVLLSITGVKVGCSYPPTPTPTALTPILTAIPATPVPAQMPLKATLTPSHVHLVEERALPQDMKQLTRKAIQTPTPTMDPQLLRALGVLRNLEYEDLIPQVKTNESTGITQITYSLPAEMADKRYVISALGQQLPTRFRDRLPEGVEAVVSKFPKGTTDVIGPFVWVNDKSVSRILYGREMFTVYRSQGYPENLFAEIYIQEPFGDMPFRLTDRIGDWVGEELASGEIKWGSVYLCVDEEGSFELREYPDIPPVGDAVNLMWNFNPLNPETGQREFGIPVFLRQQQFLQRSITMVSPLDNIGPSIIFRSDRSSGQTDIVAIAPYLYLPNVELFREIVQRTPFPDGSPPDPAHLIVAAGDLHLSSNGEMGPILDGEERAVTIDGREVREGSVDVSGVGNHTGFYLGTRSKAEGRCEDRG